MVLGHQNRCPRPRWTGVCLIDVLYIVNSFGGNSVCPFRTGVHLIQVSGRPGLTVLL